MFINTDGARIWAERTGSGPPVVFLSGLGYASWCWKEIVARLLNEWSCISIDNRGTGRSDKPAGPYSIQQFADDTARVMEALDVSQAHVVGHSMGGYIALTLALTHPEIAATLTLIGTSAGGPSSLPVPAGTQDAWAAAAGAGPEAFARQTMPLAFSPGWVEGHGERFESILAERLREPTPPRAWADQYSACVDYVERGIEVAEIQAPTLVVHGTADRIVPYENGKRLAQLLPRARLIALEGKGHLPFLEDSDAFCHLLATYLGARPVLTNRISKSRS